MGTGWWCAINVPQDFIPHEFSISTVYSFAGARTEIDAMAYSPIAIWVTYSSKDIGDILRLIGQWRWYLLFGIQCNATDVDSVIGNGLMDESGVPCFAWTNFCVSDQHFKISSMHTSAMEHGYQAEITGFGLRHSNAQVRSIVLVHHYQKLWQVSKQVLFMRKLCSRFFNCAQPTCSTNALSGTEETTTLSAEKKDA